MTNQIAATDMPDPMTWVVLPNGGKVIAALYYMRSMNFYDLDGFLEANWLEKKTVTYSGGNDPNMQSVIDCLRGGGHLNDAHRKYLRSYAELCGGWKACLWMVSQTGIDITYARLPATDAEVTQ